MPHLGTRSAVLLTTLTTIAAMGLSLAPAAQADVSGTVNVAAGETLKVRSAPSTTATIVTQLADNAPLSIQCKTTGTSVNGITQWDKLSNGYVSHAYVSVSASAVIPACSTTTPTVPQGRVNVAAGDTLKVRSTPSTSGTIVTSLASGTTVTIVCKTTGTSVNGITQWDKLSNGFVSHAYITMLNSVAIPTCTTTTPPPPTTSVARTEILNRANYWYRASNGQVSGVAAFGRNPSASAIEPPPGTQYYRRDCSGLIAMAWKLGSGNQPSSGAYITSPVATRINVTDLRPGDILASNGHVTMFEYWVNKSTWTYMAYDFGGGTGGTGPMEHKSYTLRSVSGGTAYRGTTDTRLYYALRSVKVTD